MATRIVIPPTIITLAAGETYVTPIEQAVDVSIYDKIDGVLQVLSYAGSPTVDYLTSMQIDYDDLLKSPSSWLSAGTQTGVNTLGFKRVPLGGSGNELLNWLRIKAVCGANTTLTFAFSGMARRTSF